MIPPISDVPAECPEVPAISQLRMPRTSRYVFAFLVESPTVRSRINASFEALDFKTGTAVLNAGGHPVEIKIEDIPRYMFHGTHRQVAQTLLAMWQILTPKQKRQYLAMTEILPAAKQAYAIRNITPRAEGKPSKAKPSKAKPRRKSKVVRPKVA